MRVSSQCLGSEDSETTHETISVAFRLGGAGIILIVSAVASSFPSLAKVAPQIGPPEIVFFIGKHFGTGKGVILSTAFIHLMQEGFESLNDPCLPKGWKELSGTLVLCSFLVIFLVEYISTAYVERLSATPAEHRHSKVSTNNDLDPPNFTPYHDEPEESPHDVEQPDVLPVPSSCADDPTIYGTHTRRSSRVTLKPSRRSSFIGHHRHESPSAHQHKAGPRLAPWYRISAAHLSDEEVDDVSLVHSHGHGQDVNQEETRKTKIISILVLQMGIMLHSIVVGLTLAITNGADFTTLLTALVFHQLFEGLSLGIRISTLPSGSRALPVILCILFSITAPVGVFLGVLFLPLPPKTVASNIFIMHEHVNTAVGGLMEDQTATLTKGLMCALSAGMLIYAGGVEMLAGDFVMDPEMRQLSIRKQSLGLGSLILGAVAMWIISKWS